MDYKITIEYDMQYYNLTERHIYEGLSEEEQEEHTKIKYGETLGVSARDKSGYILDKITVDGRPVDLTQDIAIWMDGNKEVIFYYVKKQTPVPNPDPSPEPTPDPDPTPDPSPAPDQNPTPDIGTDSENEMEMEEEKLPEGPAVMPEDSFEDITDESVPAGPTEVPDGVANPQTGDKGLGREVMLLVISILGIITLQLKKKSLR
ncbi:MAG: hypothetical protein RR525_10080 [Cellulosilyticaceae bacterium]